LTQSEGSSPEKSGQKIFSKHDKIYYLLSIDPGKSTGIALGVYGDTVPYIRIGYWQVEGGLEGFCRWYEEHDAGMVDVVDHVITLFGQDGGGSKHTVQLDKVAEKFTLSSGNQYVADLTPVEIEGALYAYGEDITWQSRSDKALVKDAVLKKNGMWLTGRMVGCKDARDANDATIHALVHMMRKRHIPTVRHYFTEELCGND
jgi:hypothetical protein